MIWGAARALRVLRTPQPAEFQYLLGGPDISPTEHFGRGPSQEMIGERIRLRVEGQLLVDYHARVTTAFGNARMNAQSVEFQLR